MTEVATPTTDAETTSVRPIAVAVGGEIVTLDPEVKDTDGYHPDPAMLGKVNGYIEAGVNALRVLGPKARAADIAARLAAIEVGHVLRCVIDADGYPKLNWLKAPESVRMVIAGMFTEVFPVATVASDGSNAKEVAEQYAAYKSARDQVQRQWSLYVRDGMAWAWAKELVAPEITADEMTGRAIVIGPEGAPERVYGSTIPSHHLDWLKALYKRNGLNPPAFLVPKLPKGAGTGSGAEAPKTPKTGIEAAVIATVTGKFSERDALTGARSLLTALLIREVEGKRTPGFAAESDAIAAESDGLQVGARLYSKLVRSGFESMTEKDCESLSKLTGRNITPPSGVEVEAPVKGRKPRTTSTK